MATHSGILAWRIPWTEEPGRLQSMGSPRVGPVWVTSTQTASHLPWLVLLLARLATSLPTLFSPTILPCDFAACCINIWGLFPHSLNGDHCVTYRDSPCWKWHCVTSETKASGILAASVLTLWAYGIEIRMWRSQVLEMVVKKSLLKTGNMVTRVM